MNKKLEMKKINKDKIICVVGLGYVGLPLFYEFSKYFKTIGYDTNKKKINKIKRQPKLIKNFFLLTSDSSQINKADIIVVCLPTPINNKKLPDITMLKHATKVIAKNMKKNSIIVYESTVYPGTTEAICLPILEQYSQLTEGKDFHIGYSPERINPGDNKNTLVNIVKVVSARQHKIAKLISKVYQKIVTPKIFIASSIRVAETAKIIENVQRDVNIALINELSLICSKLNLNTKDVLKAAYTKWNFLKFKPGLVGGHCIGVDPYYLSFLSKQIGHNPILIDSGRKINDSMVNFVFQNIKRKIKKTKPRILIMGITFKKNCDDIRNSKILELAKILKKNKFQIYLHDPLVNIKIYHEIKSFLEVKNINDSFKKKFDAIIIGAGHNIFKNYRKSIYKTIIKKNGYIFDLDYYFATGDIKKIKNINFWNL